MQHTGNAFKIRRPAIYQNLMVTTKQKATIDMQTKRKSNPNTTLKIVIEMQEKRTKQKGKKKDLQKQMLNN